VGLTESGDYIEVSAERGADGAFVVTIDTGELPKDRVLRVNINDGAVLCARPDEGGHDLDYIGDYINEVDAQRR
jgi:hypothetical protein